LLLCKRTDRSLESFVLRERKGGVLAMNPKSLEWQLVRLRYIRSLKDQLPIEFRKDIERAERAMLRLLNVALEEEPPRTLH
jgi:hypothetical protein